MTLRTGLTVLLLSLSTATPAQDPADAAAASGPRPEFVALDRNRDGYISKVEALANPEVQKRLAGFDRDRDGQLSEAEHAAAMEDNQRRILADAIITARVKAALLAAKGIPSLSISVETYEGSVQLSGFVKAPEMVSRAGRVTAGVSGVRTVHNNIAVR
jgi:hypothetical protein